MAQLSYNMNMGVALVGMMGDSAPSYARSGISSVALPFGIAVAQGTDEDELVLLADANAKVVGVTLRSHDVINDGSEGYPAKKQASVLRQGTVWVKVEQAVNPEDPVFVRHTANGGNTQKGAFRMDADTANAVAVSGAKFVSKAAAGGLAIVRINL